MEDQYLHDEDFLRLLENRDKRRMEIIRVGIISGARIFEQRKICKRTGEIYAHNEIFSFSFAKIFAIYEIKIAATL